jgi:sortase A
MISSRSASLPGRARLVLRFLAAFLFVTGLACSGWFVYSVVEAMKFQARARQYLARASVAPRPFDESSRIPATGELIGRIEISSLDVDVAVLQGTGSRELRAGIGHIRESSLPGDRGNVALAGHRDTYFRPLRHIRDGDLVTLTTPRGTYRYVVDWTSVVSPRDISVLAPDPERSTLTLITCFPFYYIGPAPRRFVVRAHLADAAP